MNPLQEVPQGSILGPSLFNHFLNDLIFVLKHTDPVNYADDNTLCAISDLLQDTIQKLVVNGTLKQKETLKYRHFNIELFKILFHATSGCTILR